MKIKIHNVGKLADATVEIDGITVIAGENDTGKSSVSKALYSVFSSFYHFNKSIYSQKRKDTSREVHLIPSISFFCPHNHFRFALKHTLLL